jgi:DNA-binding MarR family transcriptional regulator
MGQQPPDIGFKAWYGTLQASMRSFDRIEREFEQETGLPLAWFELLSFLAKGGSEKRRMSELAEALLVSRGGATRVIARMEEAGHVERVIPPDNRRVTNVLLTEQGAETAERVRPVHERLVKRYFSDAIDDDEAELLRDASVRVLDLVGDECAWLIDDLRSTQTG